MRRTLTCCLSLLALIVPELAAQSSQFGIRGLGLPGRSASARTLGSASSMGLFDGESSLNPAALWSLPLATTVLTTSQGWRTSTNPAGSGSARDNRFPQFLFGGPIPNSPIALSLSYSTYADRDFTLATIGTASPRGVPIGIIDTLSSTGGINDLRVAGAWGISSRLQVGLSGHILTGVNRLTSRRVWEDTTFLSTRQSSELDYLGYGISAGVVFRPRVGLELAGMIRQDNDLTVRQDSAETGTVDLPLTIVGPRLVFATQITRRNWSVANQGIVDQGGVAAKNTIEYSGGVEIFRNLRNRDQLPLRLGVRYAQLPFLVGVGGQPSEIGFSAGTGLRFARNQAGFDIAVERMRRTQGSAFRETAWVLSVGVSMQTGGRTGLQ
jgi:hypothetical protein